MKNLKSNSVKVVNIVYTRKPNIQIPKCLVKNSEKIQKCTFETDFELNKDGLIKKQQTVVVSKLGIKNIKTADCFCFQKQYPPIVQNIAVYQDDNRVSNIYALILGALMEQELIEAIPELKKNKNKNILCIFSTSSTAKT